MTTHNPLTEALNSLQKKMPSEARVLKLHERVYAGLPHAVHESGRRPVRSLWVSTFPIMLAASMLTAVLTFSLPTYNAYQYSISAVSDAARVSETIHDGATVDELRQIRLSVSRARETLDTLQLHGVFLSYTQAQCLSAYILYDTYLDGLAERLESFDGATDPSLAAEISSLRAYVEDSKKEAAARIEMYPKRQG